MEISIILGPHMFIQGRAIKICKSYQGGGQPPQRTLILSTIYSIYYFSLLLSIYNIIGAN